MTNKENYILAKCVATYKELKKAGMPLGEVIDIRIANRFNSCGRCVRVGTNKYVIELSRFMLDTTENEIAGTFCHELIHTIDGCMNHGRKFRAFAEAFNKVAGLHITTTNRKETVIAARGSIAKYITTCIKCGAKTYNNRMTDFVKFASGKVSKYPYRCKCGCTEFTVMKNR